MKDPKSREWIAVGRKLPKPSHDYQEPTCDVWMDVHASALSMGMSDSFRVTDAWYRDGKWWHRDRGAVKELNKFYITHWMPIPKSPFAVRDALIEKAHEAQAQADA